MYRCLFTTAACVLSLGLAPAHAATFTYDIIVTESDDANAAAVDPAFDLPDVGSLGQITITLDGAALDADGDPDTGDDIDTALPASLTTASINIGGFSSSIESPPWFTGPSGARLSNRDFSAISVNLDGGDCLLLGCTFAGGFRVENPTAAAATTFAEIEAALGDPSSGIIFSFNGDAVAEFVSFRAELAPIPLPAGAVLLLSALGAGALLRRRSDA